MHFIRTTLLAVAFLGGCGTSLRPVTESDNDAATETGGGDGGGDTGAPPASGDLGAPCASDGECLSGFCLAVGRCSKACKTMGICPNSSNWTCIVLPSRGPMCECDELSKTEIPCNGIDDNCDGVIDEGSTKCGGACVDFATDPKNCGGCAKPCPSGPNADATCTAAACGIACKPGFADCDGKPETGCEADLGSSANCGKCGNACKAGESCVAGTCSTASPVDVTILLDVTGSTQAQLTAALPGLQSRLLTPLLAIPDVNVGVSYTCEFPNSPYGAMGDRPFQGGSEPIKTEATLASLLTGYPKQSGGDAADAMIEALGTLSGLPLHPTSLGLTCSAGRVSGGCWRPEAKKVIVLFTDDIFHNGPHPTMAGLYEPYTGITPAPQDWTGVAKAMTAAKITLLFMAATSSSTGTDAQYAKMLTDLGQPATDLYSSKTVTEVDTAAAAIVARVKALRGG